MEYAYLLEVRFSWAFYRQIHIINWSFSRRWNRNWFAPLASIGRWTRIECHFFFFYWETEILLKLPCKVRLVGHLKIEIKKTDNDARVLRRQVDIRGWSLMIIQFSTPYAAAAASASAGGGRGCSGGSSSRSLFWLTIKSVASVSWSASTIIRAFSILTICVAMAVVKVVIAFVDVWEKRKKFQLSFRLEWAISKLP